MQNSFAFEVCAGVGVAVVFLMWLFVKGKPEIDDQSTKDNDA